MQRSFFIDSHIHSENITQRANEIINQLTTQFPFSVYRNLYNLSSHYFNANEYLPENVFRSIQETKEFPSTDNNNFQLKIAFLVGESRLLSLLPELYKRGINLILCADIDPFVLMHIQHQLSCLKKADNIASFKKYYYQDMPSELIDCVKKQLKLSYNHDNISNTDAIDYLYLRLTNINFAGVYNFSSNSERFTTVKTVASHLNFGMIMYDLFSEDDLNKMLDRLKGRNTCFDFINLTNVHDYDDQNKLSVFLKNIPISKECLIQYSILKGNNLVAQLAKVDEYLCFINQLRSPISSYPQTLFAKGETDLTGSLHSSDTLSTTDTIQSRNTG